MSPKWEMLRSRSEQTTKAAKEIVEVERDSRGEDNAPARSSLGSDVGDSIGMSKTDK